MGSDHWVKIGVNSRTTYFRLCSLCLVNLFTAKFIFESIFSTLPIFTFLLAHEIDLRHGVRTCYFYTIQVNANGVLSFRTPFNDFTPEPFPLGFSGSDDVVLAMYWADHDVRQAGNIFYRASTNFFHLNEVGRNISRVFSAEFEPTSLFIATWDGVPSFLGDDEIVRLRTVKLLLPVYRHLPQLRTRLSLFDLS